MQFVVHGRLNKLIGAAPQTISQGIGSRENPAVVDY
jgi:hypothetical protein